MSEPIDVVAALEWCAGQSWSPEIQAIRDLCYALNAARAEIARRDVAREAAGVASLVFPGEECTDCERTDGYHEPTCYLATYEAAPTPPAALPEVDLSGMAEAMERDAVRLGKKVTWTEET